MFDVFVCVSCVACNTLILFDVHSTSLFLCVCVFFLVFFFNSSGGLSCVFSLPSLCLLHNVHSNARISLANSHARSERESLRVWPHWAAHHASPGCS